MKDYPFSGDIHLLNKIYNFIHNHKIKSVIETGTWMGRTTQLFSMMVDNVYTIEVNEEYYKQASFLNDYDNIRRYLGDSAEILWEILRYTAKDPILFYLDAHWGDSWPLLDELKTISQYTVEKPIIVIHDCYNPYRPEYGYDEYNGQRLDYEYVKPYLDKIYKNPIVFWNKEASGEKRGVLFALGAK